MQDIGTITILDEQQFLDLIGQKIEIKAKVDVTISSFKLALIVTTSFCEKKWSKRYSEKQVPGS